MTIKEYMENMETATKEGQGLADVMLESARVWSNGACKGYCIDAMERAGYSREQISDVLACLRGAFGDLTVEEAEQVYKRFIQ